MPVLQLLFLITVALTGSHSPELSQGLSLHHSSPGEDPKTLAPSILKKQPKPHTNWAILNGRSSVRNADISQTPPESSVLGNQVAFMNPSQKTFLKFTKQSVPDLAYLGHNYYWDTVIKITFKVYLNNNAFYCAVLMRFHRHAKIYTLFNI